MWITEELESAIDIVELVSKYTSLKKAGANYKATCPFPWHSEKTPSFIVSPSKQLAYCFGCHRGWWAVKFIMDIENCDFKEAIEILGNYTGIKVKANFSQEKFEEKKSMYSLYKDTTNYYKNALKNYPEIKKYLFDRGLNDDIIRDFNIWYSDSWVELFGYLKSKWYTDEQISESQIFIDIKSKKDKFINRVIFPIQNARWDFVAFAWRIIRDWEPKYLNSPASNFYDKSNILYNLFNARSAITKEDFVIICEWYMDVIALVRWWFPNVVWVSGTALTEKHLTLVKRLTKKVYLCFDWDEAGQKATKLSLEKMKNDGFEVKIILLSGWKDPDEIITSWKDFKVFVDNAVTPIAYYIKKSKFNANSIDEKKKFLSILVEMVKSYSDAIEREFYLKEIAKLLNLSENLVYDSFNKIKFKQISKWAWEFQEQWITISYSDLVIAYCIFNEKNINLVKEKILFPELIWKNLKEILEKWVNAINSFDLNKKERYRALALKLETENDERNERNFEEELIKAINWLNREIYKKEVDKLKQLINSGNNDALNEYSKLIMVAKKAGIK